MKETLKKRPAAIIITAAVIILSTLFSVHRTLGAKCREITDGFYSGVRYEGYVHPSISKQLDERSDSANGVITLAKNYSDLDREAEELSAARAGLIEAVANKDIPDMSKANRALQGAFDNLISAAAEVDVSERDAKGLDAYLKNFKGAQYIIDNSGYNESVREFYRRTLNVFPTNMLSGPAGVEKPQLFEQEIKP